MLALLPTTLLLLATQSIAIKLSPIIIVPGTAGSQLDAKLSKPSTKHWYCDKTSDWFTLWLSVPSLLPPAINCWVDNIKLLYSPATKTYTNNVGVTTRTPFWGSTNAIEYLDPTLKAGGSDYFHDLVEALVSAGGIRNVTIRGSPYDFRRAPTSAYDGEWITKMTDLVETTVSLNHGNKVVLLSHSMGCLYTLYFLNQKDDEWKSKYVKRWIATSGVFAGAGSGVIQLMSGDASWIPGVTGMTVRDEQRSYESSMILLPTPQVWNTFPLVRASYGRNFSAEEYGEMFAATGDFPSGLERYNLVANLTSVLELPGVNVSHFYGIGVPTATAFEYDAASMADLPASFKKGPTKTVNGDGDGTVPLRSLQSAEKAWSSSNPVDVRTFAGQSHTGVLKDKEYIAAVIQLVTLR